MASSKEFYLRYCIQKIRKQQHYLIKHLNEDKTLKTIVVSVSDPSIRIAEDDELFYKDTLYDIILSQNISNNKIKYILLSDHQEQKLWKAFWGNQKPIDIDQFIVTFSSKFIALKTELCDFCMASPYNIIKFFFRSWSSILYQGFAALLLQPPD